MDRAPLQLPRSKALLWVIPLVVASILSQGHLRLVTPVPRTSPNPTTQYYLDIGYLEQSPPCGDPEKVPTGEVTAYYEAGSEIDLTVEVWQTHVGQRLQFFLSTDDEAFVELAPPATVPPGPDLFRSSGTLEYVAGGLPVSDRGYYVIRAKLPAVTKARATLRAYDNWSFFSCADVQLYETVLGEGFEGGDLAGWN